MTALVRESWLSGATFLRACIVRTAWALSIVFAGGPAARASDYSGVVQGLAALAIGCVLGLIALLLLLFSVFRRRPLRLSEKSLYSLVLIVTAVGVGMCVASGIDSTSGFDEDFVLIVSAVLGPGILATVATKFLCWRTRDV